MDYLHLPVGQIAARLPGASGVFQRYGIDFCCGGRTSLEDAIHRKKVDGAQLVRDLIALEARPGQGADWNDMPIHDLLFHLRRDFHDRHREQLPELIRLAKRVESVHGDRADCPDGLAKLLKELMDELELHMQKEECVLFPMIGAGDSHAWMPMQIMEQEHDEHGHRLERLLAITNRGQPPEDACNTWRALYAGIRSFAEDLQQHIHLENNVLFPRVRGR